MTRFEEIKNMIASARNYDDTNEIEDLPEMSIIYTGDAVSTEEREELGKLFDARERRIAKAKQVASIAACAAEKARGGLVMQYDDIYQAAYDMCLDDVTIL